MPDSPEKEGLEKAAMFLCARDKGDWEAIPEGARTEYRIDAEVIRDLLLSTGQLVERERLLSDRYIEEALYQLEGLGWEVRRADDEGSADEARPAFAAALHTATQSKGGAGA